MGITIHCDIIVSSSEAAEAVLHVAEAFACEQGWRIEKVDIAHSKDIYMADEEEIPYEGRLFGLIMHPHPDCDPLSIVFGSHGVAQDYCKTQFSPPDIHIKIIEFFKKAVQHCETLRIKDEGEYLSTGDRAHLEARLKEHAEAIRQICSETGAEEKVRRPDGRISDAQSTAELIEVKL